VLTRGVLIARKQLGDLGLPPIDPLLILTEDKLHLVGAVLATTCQGSHTDSHRLPLAIGIEGRIPVVVRQVHVR
jgi:hypothetical protein